MKALEKDRSRRYETASDFAQDINNYLSGNAVNACPPSKTYLARKFISRNRGLVTALTATLLLLLTGIAGTSFGLVQATREAKRADWQAALANSEKERAEAEKVRADARAAEAIKQQK
jgi:hypothetical protein